MLLLEIGSICTYYIAKFQDKSFVLYLCLCGFCVNKILHQETNFHMVFTTYWLDSRVDFTI